MADDLGMDDQPHQYAWRTMLSGDLRGQGKVDRLTFRKETAGWTRIVPDAITTP